MTLTTPLKQLTVTQSTFAGASTGYTLSWRQRQLIVKRSQQETPVTLPPLDRQEWLVECLRRSPVQLVKLELEMGEAELKFWADACERAGKPVYVEVPSTPQLPRKQSPIGWLFKRSIDRAAAALLLLALGPIMLALMLLMRVNSPGPIFFSQWRVGERGKLFRILKFRTMVVNAEKQHHQVMGQQNGLHKLKNDPRVTPMGRWMRKYSLDELPQLLNVLRGEMSLVGPRPWALYDAVRIDSDLRHRLNALPGITGAWQVEARSTLLDLNLVNQSDLKYLHSWSLMQDLKFLLLTIPKVLVGFGAY